MLKENSIYSRVDNDICVVFDRLAKSPLVIYFVHSAIGKGYSGFAGDVMNDYDAEKYIEKLDYHKRNNSYVAHKCVHTTGKNFTNVINIVTNPDQCFYDLKKCLDYIYNHITTHILIDTIPLGTGIYARSMDECISKLSKILKEYNKKIKLVIHTTELNDYNTILKLLDNKDHGLAVHSQLNLGFVHAKKLCQTCTY